MTGMGDTMAETKRPLGALAQYASDVRQRARKCRNRAREVVNEIVGPESQATSEDTAKNPAAVEPCQAVAEQLHEELDCIDRMISQITAAIDRL